MFCDMGRRECHLFYFADTPRSPWQLKKAGSLLIILHNKCIVQVIRHPWWKLAFRDFQHGIYFYYSAILSLADLHSVISDDAASAACYKKVGDQAAWKCRTYVLQCFLVPSVLAQTYTSSFSIVPRKNVMSGLGEYNISEDAKTFSKPGPIPILIFPWINPSTTFSAMAEHQGIS